jgi:hypothetical protein
MKVLAKKATVIVLERRGEAIDLGEELAEEEESGEEGGRGEEEEEDEMEEDEGEEGDNYSDIHSDSEGGNYVGDDQAWEVESIVQHRPADCADREKIEEYLVSWFPPANGEPYEDSWEPPENVKHSQ